MSELQQLVSRAKDLARLGDKEAAMELANYAVHAYPKELHSWLLRSYLHERNRNYGAASADVTRAIEISPLEPSLFFDRGRHALALGEFSAAVADFNRGLELCEYHKNDYYREALHFMRAEALIQQGRASEALADLTQVREGYTLWTSKLRTKADLLSDCEKRGG